MFKIYESNYEDLMKKNRPDSDDATGINSRIKGGMPLYLTYSILPAQNFYIFMEPDFSLKT